MELVEKGGLAARLLGWMSRRRDQADKASTSAQPGDSRLAGMDREQLLDAHSRLTRQIEVLAAGPVNHRDATPQTAVLIADLRAALGEVNAGLARLDSGDLDGAADAAPDPTPDAIDVELTEVARLGDPAILSDFSWSMLNAAEDPGGMIWVSYLLICNRCEGGDMFFISYFPTVAPDPSPYAGFAPGDTVRFAPCGARCIQCGAERTLFDPATAGHDGVLNGGSTDDAEETCPTEDTGAATLYVALGYRTPIDELEAIASKADVAPADLFDAISIRGDAPDGHPVFLEQYDCSPRQTDIDASARPGGTSPG